MKVLLWMTIFSLATLSANAELVNFQTDKCKTYECIQDRMIDDFEKGRIKQFEKAAKILLRRSKEERHLDTPLHEAAYNNRLTIAKQLIELGFDVNHTGQGLTPLMLAAMSSNEKLAKLLLKKGAQTEIKSRKCNDRYNVCVTRTHPEGWTALMFSRSREGWATLPDPATERALLRGGAILLGGVAEGHYDFELGKFATKYTGPWLYNNEYQAELIFGSEASVLINIIEKENEMQFLGTYSFTKSKLTVVFDEVRPEFKKAGLKKTCVWNGGILGNTLFLNDSHKKEPRKGGRFAALVDSDC